MLSTICKKKKNPCKLEFAGWCNDHGMQSETAVVYHSSLFKDPATSSSEATSSPSTSPPRTDSPKRQFVEETETANENEVRQLPHPRLRCDPISGGLFITSTEKSVFIKRALIDCSYAHLWNDKSHTFQIYVYTRTLWVICFPKPLRVTYMVLKSLIHAMLICKRHVKMSLEKCTLTCHMKHWREAQMQETSPQQK